MFSLWRQGTAGSGCSVTWSHVNRDTPLYYATSKNEGDSNNEWQMAKTIPLPVHYDCCLVGAPEGYIFLLGVPKVQGTLGPACFSLDIKTLKIQRVNHMRLHHCHVYPYFSFPPFMLPRMVWSGKSSINLLTFEIFPCDEMQNYRSDLFYILYKQE